MKYIIQNENTLNQLVEIDRSVWTGKINVTVDGKMASKISKKEFSYENVEGELKYITLKGSEFSKMEVTIDTYTHTLVRKLKVYEFILAFLPVFLIAIGGAIGGFLAGVAIISLLMLMRSLKNVFLKVLVSLVFTAAAFFIWFIIASMILSLI